MRGEGFEPINALEKGIIFPFNGPSPVIIGSFQPRQLPLPQSSPGPRPQGDEGGGGAPRSPCQSGEAARMRLGAGRACDLLIGIYEGPQKFHEGLLWICHT